MSFSFHALVIRDEYLEGESLYRSQQLSIL